MDHKAMNDAIIAEFFKRFSSQDELQTGRLYNGVSPFRQERAAISFPVHEGVEGIRGSIRIFPSPDSSLNANLKGFAVLPIFFSQKQAPAIAATAKRRLSIDNISALDVAAELAVVLNKEGHHRLHSRVESNIKYFPRYEAELIQPNQMSMANHPVIRIRYCNHTVAQIALGHTPQLKLGQTVVAEGPLDRLFGGLISSRNIATLLGGQVPSKEVMDLRIATLLKAVAASQRKQNYTKEMLSEHFGSLLFTAPTIAPPPVQQTAPPIVVAVIDDYLDDEEDEDLY